MHRTDWSEFEDNLVALCREDLGARPGGEAWGDNGVDLYLVGHSGELAQVEIKLTTGSGKSSAYKQVIQQVKRWRPGFSVSARTLTRAGLNTDMRWNYTVAHEVAHVQLRSWGNGARGWPRCSAPAAAYTRVDLRSTTEKAVGCAPALTLTVGIDAPVARTDGSAAEPASHRRRSYEPVVQHAAQILLELGRVLLELAMATRSRCGLLAAPLPTTPPGEIVRSHPRVPRGPGAVSGTATFWPTGGMLSMA
ncbi:hypothetical protein ACWDUH_02330 [Micromonospora wenchangensis]